VLNEGQTTQSFSFGNLHDDDGQVFDDAFRPNPDPGLPYPTADGTPVAKNTVVPTRLITGTRTLTAPSSLNTTKPVLLLPRDDNRCDLSLFFTPFETTANLLPSFDTNGAQAGPTAATQLADITPTVPGWYDVLAVVQTYGTTASPADDNNIRTVLGGVQNIEAPIQMYSGTTGSGRIERRYRVYFDGTRTLFLEVIANATATAIYSGSLLLTRVSDTQSLQMVVPILLGYDQAAAQMDSVSARVNIADLTAPLCLGNHTGEVWATMIAVPDTAYSTIKVSWMATSK